MKRNILLAVMLCFSVSMVIAQEKALSAEQAVAVPHSGKTKKHKIVKGDTWYSIAKKYTITYADLRLANKDSSDKLRIGDTLIIPINMDVKYDSERTEKNIILDNKKETAKKIYTVKAKENLRLIAKKYQITVDQLVEWNKLSSKTIKPGQKLIVAVVEKKVVQQKDTSGVVKVTDKKDVAIVKNETSKKDTVSLLAIHKAQPDTISPSKIERDTSKEKKLNITFAKGRKEVSEEGQAAWIEDEDINPGKYFALHRTAPIGTIIKVTNRMNRRVVFVKVVGKLPDTGDNENLILKISKAAADKLGVLDVRFQAELSYGIPES